MMTDPNDAEHHFARVSNASRAGVIQTKCPTIPSRLIWRRKRYQLLCGYPFVKRIEWAAHLLSFAFFAKEMKPAGRGDHIKGGAQFVIKPMRPDFKLIPVTASRAPP